MAYVVTLSSIAFDVYVEISYLFDHPMYLETKSDEPLALIAVAYRCYHKNILILNTEYRKQIKDPI